MSDNLRPEDRRKTMQAVKGKGTRLEKRLFSMLAGMRLNGWKKNVNSIVGKPDVVFVSQRVVIFIDGCFWHNCPHCRRKLPKTNRKYWERKINRNAALAKSNNRRLRADGWAVVRIWGHEMDRSTSKERVKSRILQVVGDKEKKLGKHPVRKAQATKP